jgi:hypothetical protein
MRVIRLPMAPLGSLVTAEAPQIREKPLGVIEGLLA